MSSNFDDDFEIPDEITDEILNFLKKPTDSNPAEEIPPSRTEKSLIDEAMLSLRDQIQLPRKLVLSILNYELDLIETLEQILAYVLEDGQNMTDAEMALYNDIKNTIIARRMMNSMNTATVRGMRSV